MSVINTSFLFHIAALRLSLVSQNTAEARYLSQALFGILMLLPQTEAFTLLNNRLQCIPHTVTNTAYVQIPPLTHTHAHQMAIKWISHRLFLFPKFTGTRATRQSIAVASTLRNCSNGSSRCRRIITNTVAISVDAFLWHRISSWWLQLHQIDHSVVIFVWKSEIVLQPAGACDYRSNILGIKTS